MPSCLPRAALPPLTPACMARSTLRHPMSARCSSVPCLESCLMDSLNPENLPPPLAAEPVRPRRQLYGVWGIVIFAAMFLGQIAVVGFFVLRQGPSLDLGSAITVIASSGLAISLSVIGGLPTVLAALWLAIRMTGASFADYLALRWASWREFVIGGAGLIVIVVGWDMVSRATGRDLAPDF